MKMKREDHSDKRRPMKTWIEKMFSSHVSGKIGIELLVESYGSFFSLYAVRMACWRSEVNCGFIRHFMTIWGRLSCCKF